MFLFFCLYFGYINWFKTTYKEIQANELFKPKIKIPGKYKQMLRHILHLALILLFMSQHLVEFLSFGRLNCFLKIKYSYKLPIIHLHPSVQSIFQLCNS